MSDPHDSVREKVLAIFSECVGERASRLDGSEISQEARDAVAAALASDFGMSRAWNIAFHMADWNSDAAFIVALHLFPERFSPEEIDAGIGLFLCHAPNHIREACRLTNTYVWESFPAEDKVCPETEIINFKSLAAVQIPGKGRGVVAMEAFSAGWTIERAPVIVLPRDEARQIRETRLNSYYFEWGDDCKQAAIALGYGSLYNHSYTPNAHYEFREPDGCLEFIALRDIGPGEEITINYNNLGPSANQPLKFDVRD